MVKTNQRKGAREMSKAEYADEISPEQDIIDSRDVERRIKYLTADLKQPESYTGEHKEEREELKKLKDLKEAIGNDEEWEFGITLINDNYFEEYAQEFAEDIGAIEKNGQWPTNFIDWERAADELRIDYMEVDFDGATFWYR
jgi:hypothetical protein